jgi:hypothetical protein
VRRSPIWGILRALEAAGLRLTGEDSMQGQLVKVMLERALAAS